MKKIFKLNIVVLALMVFLCTLSCNVVYAATNYTLDGNILTITGDVTETINITEYKDITVEADGEYTIHSIQVKGSLTISSGVTLNVTDNITCGQDNKTITI